MRKLFLTIIFVNFSIISCLSTPDNNFSYSTGSYNTRTNNTSITPTVPSTPSITITKMDFVNKDNNGKIIDSYGTTFESSTLKFLAPRITYNSIGSTGVISLNIKIIKPDGSIDVSSSSPNGYTFNTTLNVQANKKGETVTLNSWGNERGGSYSPGNYNYEIWSKGTRLHRASFIVKSASVSNPTTTPYVPAVPSITITKMDFVNFDKDGKTIGTYGTTFDSNALRYLAPRITYDSTGSIGEIILNMKIIQPDGSIDSSPSSPIGYSYNTTLYVQTEKKGEVVTLGGWGNDDPGTYIPGNYTYEIWSKGTRLYRANFTVRGVSTISQTENSFTATSRRAETEVVFAFIGPQGVNARLYYNEQSIGTIEAEKMVRKVIPNNESNFVLKVQIGDETRELRLAARGSTTINVNITARRTPSGIIITDFDIVDRMPLYSVKYVTVDGLNVRNNINPDAIVLDVIPQDCRVEILEEYVNDWVRIKYNGNKTGCVNGTYLTTTQPPFIVTSLKIGNVNNDGRWLTNAGNALYSSQMRYLQPIVSYDATFNGVGTFFVKIIQPDGTIFRNASISPSGFTFSNECQINRGNNQTLDLSGWGNSDTSSYQAGEWTIEIWYNNRRLWSEKIAIRP